MNFGKFFKIIALSLIICIVILAGVFSADYIISDRAVGNGSDAGTVEVTGNQINILLLATDKGGLLTDTIMLASFDRQRNYLNIISIPRDTRVQTKNSHCKINAVYGMGKEGKRQEGIIKKINEITGLPIHYYMVVDPAGFRNIIDILGGVEVDVPIRMKYSDPTQDLYIDLQKGLQVLDGDKAEQFCRFRSGYATADLGRIDAQQTFLKALIKQKLKPKYLLKAKSIFREIEENVETNIGVSDMLKLLPIANAMTSNSVSTYCLPGQPKMIGGASYYIYDREETDKLISENILYETTEETSDNTETKD